MDIIVGTPGRIKDHTERGTLNLKSFKFGVLDKANEMLNMGFVDHVDTYRFPLLMLFDSKDREAL